MPELFSCNLSLLSLHIFVSNISSCLHKHFVRLRVFLRNCSNLVYTELTSVGFMVLKVRIHLQAAGDVALPMNRYMGWSITSQFGLMLFITWYLIV